MDIIRISLVGSFFNLAAIMRRLGCRLHKIQWENGCVFGMILRKKNYSFSL